MGGSSMPKFIFCFYVLKEYRSFLPKFMIFVKKHTLKQADTKPWYLKSMKTVVMEIVKPFLFCIYFKLNMSRQRI